jgi:Fic family protein
MRLMDSPRSPHRWIWQQPDWPRFRVDAQATAPALAQAYVRHGEALGKAASIGQKAKGSFPLDAWVDEVQATAAIEGERLERDAVRSSVIRRLGWVEDPGASATTNRPADAREADRGIDGLVAVLSDASLGCWAPLDEDRLCRWQAALFPGGTSGIRRIAVGRYRSHEDPMQIVSGQPARETVHYEAPASMHVPALMQAFLDWFAATRPALPSHEPSLAAYSPAVTPTSAPATRPSSGILGGPMDGITRAAIAHLWFESIHPFEDGNGRLGRAIVDMALVQHLGPAVRLHSLSRQLLASRAAYYDALNAAQRGTLDATAWVLWFGQQCAAAYAHTSRIIDQAVQKQQFWAQHADTGLTERQKKVIQRLLDAGDGGFLGGLNAEKYIKMTGVSKATATRDLSQLVAQGQLRSQGMGKAIRYYVNVPGWVHGLGPVEPGSVVMTPQID